jgi:D-alanyl-D-alanine carboxypeptidase (penicillin-binding protein 5/6)
MTALLVMESLQQDQDLTLQTPVRVTREASQVGGRQVWLDPRETFTIDELLKCTLIFSANDAAYLLGQFLAGGDVHAFVDRMNRRARELGMTHFTFHNPNGLPEGKKELENTGCVRELSYVAGRLLEYPEVLKWSQTRVEHLASPRRKQPTLLTTTNKLLGTVPGVNGMKTGFTDDAGWCMAATCERNGRTVIVVVVGCSDAKLRNPLVTQLVNWAYEQR